MTDQWKTIRLNSVDDVLSTLIELQGRRWLCRGHARAYGTLVPSLDRPPLQSLTRVEKLALERQSINTFRSAAKFFASVGERRAMVDDIIAMAVLRHYGERTRLLDWSRSPFIATYFAVCSHDDADGELWSFDYTRYAKKGHEQWERWKQTTEGNPPVFNPHLTAFLPEKPPDWFICVFYDAAEFPRQNAQFGFYSMTARFGRDHARSIAKLLDGRAHHRRYVIRAKVKRRLREELRERHGIWGGALFPDTAGAARTAGEVFPKSVRD